MQLHETFHVDNLPQGDGGDFAPLPDGWYTAHLAKAELCTTKAGTGKYIKVRYDITGPTHQGRVVFGNFNVRNPNPKAEEIARQQLRELMLATGLTTLEDTDQLVGRSVQIKLVTRQQDGYEPSNDVRAFKAVEGGSMPKPAAVAAPAAPAAPTGVATPPWGKK